MDLQELISEIRSGRGGGRPDPLSFTPDQLTSFSEFGVHFHSSRELAAKEVGARFKEVREWMRFAGDTPGLNAVYLDTTTLHTIQELVLNRDASVLNPSTLLDLTTFVNSVILYDHIFHLENPHLDSSKLNEALGNERIVICLPVSSFSGGLHGDEVHSLGAILRGLWYGTKQYVDELLHARDSHDPLQRDLEEIEASWATLLGLDRLDPTALTRSHDSVLHDGWDSDGPGLLEQLVSATATGSDYALIEHARDAGITNIFYEIIGECNYRSFFNQLVASSMLKLSYFPNSCRMPFRHYLYKQARVVERELPSLSLIEKAYMKERASAYFSDVKLLLPFFPAAIIHQISELSEFFETLTDIRSKAAGLRQIRAELDKNLREGRRETEKALLFAFEQEASNLRTLFPLVSVAGAVAAVLPSLGGATTPGILTAIGMLTLASQFPKEAVEKLKRRITAPQFWFLPDLRDTASALASDYPKICRIWGTESLDIRVVSSHFSLISELFY